MGSVERLLIYMWEQTQKTGLERMRIGNEGLDYLIQTTINYAKFYKE